MTSRWPKRMTFIPMLKERITMQLQSQGIADNIINNAFAAWDRGEEPATPWERACFDVFAYVQGDVERTT